MRLGILGGTFDPPHFGHLKMAEAALHQLQLNKVLFAPAGVQPLKQTEPSSAPEQRARMVELAIAPYPRFELSRIDLDRPGPHYTVDLLAIVQQQYPAAALWFILGEDSLSDLLRWRDPARLIELARLAVLHRSGGVPPWHELTAALPRLPDRIDWLDRPEIDISASDLRQRLQHGQPVDQLIPPEVIAYLTKHQLYS